MSRNSVTRKQKRWNNQPEEFSNSGSEAERWSLCSTKI